MNRRSLLRLLGLATVSAPVAANALTGLPTNAVALSKAPLSVPSLPTIDDETWALIRWQTEQLKDMQARGMLSTQRGE